MNLSTSYLGLNLKNPIICASSPLSSDLDSAKKLEDAGVAALVMSSLFEEEIMAEVEEYLALEAHGESFAEAVSYMAEPHGFHLGPDGYLENLQRIRQALSIPVIGSLNGATPGGWTSYAKKIEEAGADALELNLYLLATDSNESGTAVEQRSLDIVSSVKGEVSIPVAVKVSPYYSSFANMASRFAEAGADGLVLFNRYYQPGIDVDNLQTVPELHLSTSSELTERLRWLALLSGQVGLDLSATGGVHSAADILKALMAGARSVQMVSALLQNGPELVSRNLEAISFWLKEHEYASLEEVRGSLALERTPKPAVLARANYMKVLDSWQ